MITKGPFFYLCILSLTAQATCIGQTVRHKKDKTIIFVKEYYKRCGKLLNISKDVMLEHFQMEHSFLPSDQDVLMTEQLLQQRYDALIQTDQRFKLSLPNYSPIFIVKSFIFDYDP